MSRLMELYPDEVQAILAKYPPEHKRSAVMPLLYLAQRERGYITMAHMEDIADLLDITPAEVASVVGFYTLFHDKPAGKVLLQLRLEQVRMLKTDGTLLLPVARVRRRLWPTEELSESGLCLLME